MIITRSVVTISEANAADLTLVIQTDGSMSIWKNQGLRSSPFNNFNQVHRLNMVFPGLNILVEDKKFQ